MYKINAKPNTSVSTDTFKNKIPQRPWSVNYALLILFITALYGFVSEITKDTFELTILLKMAIFCIALFGIYKGNILIRNIFFIITLPMLLFLVIGSVLILQSLITYTYATIESIIYFISILASYVMLFIKPSEEWFLAIEDSKTKKKSLTISWNFQLTLIILSISIGFFIMLLNISFVDIKELVQLVYPYEEFRFAAFITYMSISLFISSLILLLPFGILIGYWRKDNSSILTRIITMGVILPSIPFTPSNTLEIMGYFFIVKVIMTAYITHFSINLGTKVYAYIKKDTI